LMMTIGAFVGLRKPLKLALKGIKWVLQKVFGLRIQVEVKRKPDLIQADKDKEEKGVSLPWLMVLQLVPVTLAVVMVFFNILWGFCSWALIGILSAVPFGVFVDKFVARLEKALGKKEEKDESVRRMLAQQAAVAADPGSDSDFDVDPADYSGSADSVPRPPDGGAIGKLFGAEGRQVTKGIIAKERNEFLEFHDNGRKEVLRTKDGREARFKVMGSYKDPDSGQIVKIIEDNEHIRGFANKENLYLSESLVKSLMPTYREIATYHELRHNYYARHPEELPIGINAHTFLRGCGKEVREMVKKALKKNDLKEYFTAEEIISYLGEKLSIARQNPVEIALIRYNEEVLGKKGIELLYGEQDRKFGARANDDFSRELQRQSQIITSSKLPPKTYVPGIVGITLGVFSWLLISFASAYLLKGSFIGSIFSSDVPLLVTKGMISAAFIVSGLVSQHFINLYRGYYRYKELFDDSPVAFHTLDKDFRITGVNKRWCELLGYTEKEVRKHEIFEFIYVDPSDEVDAEKQIRNARERAVARMEGKTVPDKIGYGPYRKYRTKNGKPVIVETRDTTLRDTQNRPTGIQTSFVDVTEAVEAVESLEKERGLLKSITSNTPDFIFVKDTKSRLVFSNDAHFKALGAASFEEVRGSTDFGHFPDELARKYYDDEQGVMKSGIPLIGEEERFIDSSGSERWLSTTKVPLRDSGGEIIGIVGISRDITELRNLQIKDPRTGAYDRKFLLKDEFRARWSMSVERAKHTVSVLMCDLDHFKRFNEAPYDHDTGDLVLRAVVRRIAKELRDGDILVRHGGEEFLVILFNTDAEETGVVANRILSSVRGLFISDEKRGDIDDITISIGGAELTDEEQIQVGIVNKQLAKLVKKKDIGEEELAEATEKLAPLWKRADLALVHRAKREGRDRYVFSEPNHETEKREDAGKDPGSTTLSCIAMTPLLPVILGLNDIATCLTLVAVLAVLFYSIVHFASSESASSGGEGSEEHLISILDSFDLEASCQAAIQLGNIGGEKAAEALLGGRLVNLEPTYKAYKTEALGNIAASHNLSPETAKRISDLLFVMLNDGDKDVQRAAADALEAIGEAKKDDMCILYAYLYDPIGKMKHEGVLERIEMGLLTSRLIGALNLGSKVQGSAVNVLSRVADPQVVEALIDQLTNEDANFRVAVIKALRDIGKRLSERVNNAKARGRKPDPNEEATKGRVTEVLFFCSENDPDTRVREAAARSLGLVGGPEISQRLSGMLKKKDSWQVKEAAIESLGKTGDARGATAIFAIMGEGGVPHGAYLTCLRALGEISHSLRRLLTRNLPPDMEKRIRGYLKAINSNLVKGLEDERMDIRAVAAETLLIKCDVSELKDIISDPEKVLRAHVIINQKEEQALPTAAGITQEMAIEFTTKAIVEKKWSKLAELGQHAAPALLKALNDPVAFFRQKAAETLQVVRHPLTIAPLWERLFIEKSNDVSYAIAQAILAMGGENAEKELKKFIEEHPDPAIWKVTTLYLMGETKKASTMIKKLLEENDQEIIQKFLEDRLEKGFPKEEKEPLKKLIDMGVTIHFDILADQGSSKTARIDALRFLGKYGAEKQVDGLVTASKSNDMEIVKEAGTALASINERQVRKKIPTYLEVLADPGASSRARVEAADFLGEYGGPAERKALVNAAGGMDFKVTKAITMAISKIDKRHGGKKKGSHGFAFLPFAIPQNFSELIEIIKESPVWCGAIALGALAVFAGLILFLRFVYHRLRPVVWNLKRIGSKNPAKRKAAAAALGELAPFKEKEIEEVISALEETTRDKVSAVRMAAAEAIGKIGKEAENAIPDLVRLVIEDEDPQVRITAAKSLGETGLMGIFALAEKLKDEDAAVRLSAAKAFGNVDPKTPKIEHIFVNLEGTLEDPDKDVRDAGMNAFSSLDALTPERKVKRYIADLGDGQHVGVRDEAMRQLDELDAVTIGLRVKKYMFDLEDDNAEVRKSGAEKLGKLGVYARGLGRKIRGTDEEFREMLNELKKAAPILVQMLQKDEGAGIRAAAAAALGDIGPVTFEVVPALVKAVKDPEAKVRESAILALCKFPAATPNMTNAIIGAAGDKNEGVRAAAARFFGGVKPASDRVISVLVKLSGDPDENVRRDARTVLEKLEKPQAAVPS
ncbi:MAG: HEAT repeat domain-containing protein, partial [Candidatus Omnitrophota bacterium]